MARGLQTARLQTVRLQTATVLMARGLRLPDRLPDNDITDSDSYNGQRITDGKMCQAEAIMCFYLLLLVFSMLPCFGLCARRMTVNEWQGEIRTHAPLGS